MFEEIVGTSRSLQTVLSKVAPTGSNLLVTSETGSGNEIGMPRSTLESKIRSLKINKNRFKSADLSSN
jgi:transcriptional regulator with PAS, ATPase and Fis domain